MIILMSFFHSHLLLFIYSRFFSSFGRLVVGGFNFVGVVHLLSSDSNLDPFLHLMRNPQFYWRLRLTYFYVDRIVLLFFS